MLRVSMAPSSSATRCVGVSVATEKRVSRRLNEPASQVARAPGAVRGERFFRMGIEPAGVDVPLEPGAKPRQLARGKLFDGFLDVFGGGHGGNIAFVPITGTGNPSCALSRPMSSAIR